MTDWPDGPQAPTMQQIHSHHGHDRSDPYAWLRADHWQEVMQDPDQLPEAIRTHLERENAHAESVLATTGDLRQRLRGELRGRIHEDDASVPAADGPWAYYSRYRTGGQHPIHCRCPRGNRRQRAEAGVDAAYAGETILLDGDVEAAGHPYFRVLAFAHSPDHRRVAWSVDVSGSETCLILVRDLATGETHDTGIRQARGDLAWASDSDTLYYTLLDASHRGRWVRRHRLADGEDRLVHEEHDPGFFIGVERSLSGRWLIIHSHDHVTSEQWVVPADHPEQAPVCLSPRIPGVDYRADDAPDGNGWIVLDNGGGADDFRIRRCPVAADGALDPERAETLVGHRSGRLIESMLCLGTALVRQELEDGLPRIVVRRWSDGSERSLDFAEAGYSLTLHTGHEVSSTRLRFSYSSYATPWEVHEEPLEGGERERLKAQFIPSGHRPEDYVTRRLLAPTADGEQVPVSLIHRRDLQPDAGTPLLLDAYGAYGLVDLPAFSGHRFNLIDRGFVYAHAHVRGGRDKGDRWYRQGKREHKPNTFSDTIAAAEALIAAGWTGPGRLALQGGSAGGMLVGAVLNQRPDLFHAAIADVPFVDVLTTMLDASLPLTPPEWPEWGNPLASAGDYHSILAYSPYDNVRNQAYPHLLVTAGVSDPRVTYWEPAKWVAKLRAMRSNRALLLLKTNMSAGHGGASGRFDHLDEIADRQAFLLLAFGRVPGVEPPPVQSSGS